MLVSLECLLLCSAHLNVSCPPPVPTSSCNGLELALPRTLQSSLEEQVCLIATVRLVTPQFLKVRPLVPTTGLSF